jgi:hypothetical protein
MDNPTSDQPTREDPAPHAALIPKSARDDLVQTRLQGLVGAAEPIVAWTRGWVSRELRAHRLLAARTLDFAVVTDHNLFLFSTGFFRRRPRRLVYSCELDQLQVIDHDVPIGRRVTLRNGRAPMLRLELSTTVRAAVFVKVLVTLNRARRK